MRLNTKWIAQLTLQLILLLVIFNFILDSPTKERIIVEFTCIEVKFAWSKIWGYVNEVGDINFEQIILSVGGSYGKVPHVWCKHVPRLVTADADLQKVKVRWGGSFLSEMQRLAYMSVGSEPLVSGKALWVSKLCTNGLFRARWESRISEKVRDHWDPTKFLLKSEIEHTW